MQETQREEREPSKITTDGSKKTLHRRENAWQEIS